MKKKPKENLTVAEQRRTLHTNLDFASAEAYKLLRTNLMFTLPESETSKCQIVGITSPNRSEGKSTTSVNLAYSLAEAGKKVLLIDADMRLPSIEKKLELYSEAGLSDALISASAGKKAEVTVVESGILPNWHVMLSGSLPPNPSELLSSSRMKRLLTQLSESYEFILVDLPPVNVVSDALAISPYLDGIIVVVREDYTDKKALKECVRQLQMANVKLLGFVLNQSKEDGKKYGKYYKKANT